MSYQVNASSEAIISLVSNLNNGLKNLNEINNELESDLKKLGNTFQDDGFLVVKNYVDNSKKKVEDVLPEFKNVMGKLLEYARIIRESESKIK